MKPRISLRQSLQDPNLLGGVLSGDSWRPWRTLLIAAMGESLYDDEREIFTKLTDREREPGQRVNELVAVIGRRGGKSRAMASSPAISQGYATTLMRWCLASAVSCSVSRSISGWPRSFSTTPRPASSTARSCAS